MPSTHDSVISVQDLRTGFWFDSWFLSEDYDCDKFVLNPCCPLFNYGYVGKQHVAWKAYCAKHWEKELQKTMDRCSDWYSWNNVENGFKQHTINYNHCYLMMSRGFHIMELEQCSDKRICSLLYKDKRKWVKNSGIFAYWICWFLTFLGLMKNRKMVIYGRWRGYTSILWCICSHTIYTGRYC